MLHKTCQLVYMPGTTKRRVDSRYAFNKEITNFSDGYPFMTIGQSMLPEFDQEMKNTRKMLERVPDGKFDYKPHEKSMTLGRLAAHVAPLASLQ